MPQKPLSYLFIAAQTQYMTQTPVQIQVKKMNSYQIKSKTQKTNLNKCKIKHKITTPKIKLVMS